jgi:predicted nucleotidyltransferase
MQRELTALVNRMTGALGDRLVCVILYGSAADGDHHGSFSDINLFCVLKHLTPKELADSEPIFRWWRELGHAAPLLMTEEETRSSTDCFPIEFHDMKERRKVLHGRDIIAEIEVDRRFWRAHLEHDLRAKLLRLRQQATGILSDRDRLLRLCIDSVSTFLVLGRHALLYSGRPVQGKKREIVSELESALGIPMTAFGELLSIREQKTAPQDTDAATLFEKYLKQISALVAFVDQMEERQS